MQLIMVCNNRCLLIICHDTHIKGNFNDSFYEQEVRTSDLECTCKRLIHAHHVGIGPNGDIYTDAHARFSERENVGVGVVLGQCVADAVEPIGIVAVDALVPEHQLQIGLCVVDYGKSLWGCGFELPAEGEGGCVCTVGWQGVIHP